ncbi:MAG: SGNH/GDSL hydrolase family protein [Acidobacteria bacterium]|nr:SGNH/GDSL hydrolase family protein [Planctomycetota bacterium]MBE3132101.1 SGNH/GDSL hydrolase family protein [Acidobacteriota bacterium]
MPLGLAADAAAAKAPPLAKGDRIVFLGDSITEGGGGKTGYITLIQEALSAQHKDLGIETVNAGISGHKVPDLQGRLDKDVIAKKPTIVFIYIGINDVWHWHKQADGTMTGGTTKEAFEAGLKDIIARIKAAGARVILCTPTVIGEKPDGKNERDAMLEEYSALSRGVAKGTGTPLLDLRNAFIAYLKKHNKENKDRGILTADSVHLSDAGNRLVADQMLGALGAKPTK